MISNHILSNFLIFSTQADNDSRHERRGVAEDAGEKEEKGQVTLVLR